MPPAELFFFKLHKEDNCSDFDCGHADTNEFIKEDAIKYQRKSIAITYVIKEENNVVGFVSLGMGAIRVKGISELKIPGIDINAHPALKIGRLGVDKRYTKRGLGTQILSFSMSKAMDLKKIIGCRLLSVDAYPERIRWYKERGFESIISSSQGRETIPMYAIVG